MKIYNSITKVLLILAFLIAGIMKLITPYAEMLEDPSYAWTEGYTSFQIIIISLVELISAVILLVSFFRKNMNTWVFIVGVVLVIDMIGAMVTHVSRDESIVANLVLLLLALSLSIIKFIEFNRQ